MAAWSTIPCVKVQGNEVIKSFFMSETLITQRVWLLLMATNSSKFTDQYFLNAGIAAYPRADAPVENLSFELVEIFLRELRKRTFNPSWRLPTVEEWEYAARGGNKNEGYQYPGSDNLYDVAWYAKNSYRPVPVGKKLPNELGLYDMLGNVWELTSSTKVEDRYNFVAIKGGSYENTELSIEKTSWIWPKTYSDNIGFRVIRDVHPLDL